MSARVDVSYMAWCEDCEEGAEYTSLRAAEGWADQHDAEVHPDD